MATVSAASTFAGATLPGRPAVIVSPSVLGTYCTAPRNLNRAGLPRLACNCKGGTVVRCSTQAKPSPRVAGAVASALAMAVASTATTGPALALVDERLSTEGTGLSLGISNNLLAWILLGVFGLIWALYFTYTSTLDEDDDSALSL
ncbi:photosystem II reaction center W protein, chloroplastic-like [Curcuma longa]|uniref:photosystem II reaction center W protein, chloroplastic-like n=1 Tax=Curcuma longa TaxID=136217 RepID=UPI003D9E39EE